MFTGIIEEAGRVRAFERGEKAWNLMVDASNVLQELETGDSIAVNGCCLTAVTFDSESISFDLLEETVRLTNFAHLRQGDPVNLERSLRFNGKLGGHFVTGHIDGPGEIVGMEKRGPDTWLRIAVEPAFLPNLISKGSIAIDGISLTVAELYTDGFAVWLIPHTLKVTNLHTRQVGDRVNLEYDMLGKYVLRLAETGQSGTV